MSAIDRAAELRELVAKCLNKLGPIEDYPFDWGPTLHPGGAGYLLIISRRSPVLVPAWIACPWLIANGYPQEADIQDAVTNAFAKVNAQYQLMLTAPGG